jgi:hypothetical protein
MMTMCFDREKFAELVLYVIAKSADDPAFSHVKLNKILCMSDFLAFAKLGHPMTGATYRAGEHGPVADELAAVQKALIEWGEATMHTRDYPGKTHQRLVPLRAPDLDRLTAPELALVDAVIARLLPGVGGTASESRAPEPIAWQLAPRGVEIPYASIFLSPEPLTEADIARGQALAAQHGYLQNSD